MSATLPPITPGNVLLEEFMLPLGLSQNELARRIDVPVSRIAGIVHGHRAITADTASRLGRLFGTSAQFWLNLQSWHDLERLEDEGLAGKLASIIPVIAA
ncbi:MAG: HigA family addiction module antidote protein [Notoacmeibacter sp.]|nr:HigA family addiction module antidote protein [Notoacmeibacter sp.]